MTAINRAEQLAVSQPHDHDDICNTSSNPSLNDIIDARLSRRSMFKAAFGSAGTAVLGTVSLSACGGGSDSAAAAAPPAAVTPVAPSAVASKLGFTPVAKSIADTVTIASGYTATPIFALGDPITAGTPAYKNDGTDTDFDNRAGDHHDGMEYFGLAAIGNGRDANSNDRGLLVMNHEAITKANITDPTKFISHWPGNAGYGAGGATARPRSATIVISKTDGGVIGT